MAALHVTGRRLPPYGLGTFATRVPRRENPASPKHMEGIDPNPGERSLYARLWESLTQVEVTDETIVPIAVRAMESVESVTDLSGLEKRALVIRLMSDYVGTLHVPALERQYFGVFIQRDLPFIIDAICAASSGQYALHSTAPRRSGRASQGSGCFSTCRPRRPRQR